MIRPQVDGEAMIAASIGAGSLEAVTPETGRLAIQVGGVLDRFYPSTWVDAVAVRTECARVHRD